MQDKKKNNKLYAHIYQNVLDELLKENAIRKKANFKIGMRNLIVLCITIILILITNNELIYNLLWIIYGISVANCLVQGFKDYQEQKKLKKEAEEITSAIFNLENSLSGIMAMNLGKEFQEEINLWIFDIDKDIDLSSTKDSNVIETKFSYVFEIALEDKVNLLVQYAEDIKYDGYEEDLQKLEEIRKHINCEKISEESRLAIDDTLENFADVMLEKAALKCGISRTKKQMK